MATSRTERSFVNLQLEPAALANVADCDSSERSRRDGAVIDCVPRLRQRLPKDADVTPEPNLNRVAPPADRRKEAAT
jgi:hypothetical protein